MQTLQIKPSCKLSQGINQSFAVVAAMVRAHPCLKIDFQVYLRNDGAVLNIDLDRCDELIPRTRGPLNDSKKLGFTGASSDMSSQEVSK